MEKYKQEEEQETKRGLEDWLGAANPFSNYTAALNAKQAGTGQWILENDAYKHWRDTPSTLMLLGSTGTGKTVLSAFVISQLEETLDHGNVLVYWYFDFKDSSKQTTESMCRSLLKQLLRLRQQNKPLEALYKRCEGAGRPAHGPELIQCCREALVESDDCIFIIIDALDESTTQLGVMQFIEHVTMNSTNVHMLATSREESDVLTSIDVADERRAILSLAKHDTEPDIKSFVQAALQGPAFVRWRYEPNVLKEIEAKLLSRASGM